MNDTFELISEDQESTKEARLSKPEVPSAPSQLFGPVVAPGLLTSCPPTQKAGQHSNPRLD